VPLPRGTRVIDPRDVVVQLSNPATRKPERRTLIEALGNGRTPDGVRSGAYAWNVVTPPSANNRRAFYSRIQRTLHDGYPVPLEWMVSFAHMDVLTGVFQRDYLDAKQPNLVGGHASLITDYGVFVPKRGMIPAGTPYDGKLAALALGNDADVRYLRIKNSWGTDRAFQTRPGLPAGYNDIEIDYLTLNNGRYLMTVLLPPGY